MVKKQRNALGKGLSALLENAESDITSRDNAVLGSIAEIPVNNIEANPFQPRTDFDQDALNELAESIKVHGLIQPITVRKLGYDKYQLISGERRTRASILAGLDKIPAYIRLSDDQGMLEMALIENIQRENLNAIEVALSYKRLIEECKLKQEELGERVGKKRSTVNNYLRLLKLPGEIQIAIQEGKISMGHARAMVNMDDETDQLTLFQRIMEENLSVRAAEELVRTSKNSAEPAKTVKQAFSKIDFTNYKTEQKRIASKIGANVNFKGKKGETGEIIIKFSSQDELETILSNL
jgi:ParB family chromosome partitioning protein